MVKQTVLWRSQIISPQSRGEGRRGHSERRYLGDSETARKDLKKDAPESQQTEQWGLRIWKGWLEVL